jgi:hypothetical protein
MYLTLCSLQLAQRPMTSSQVGHGKVVEPFSSSPFPHEMHFSAFFIGCAEYHTYF